MGEDSDSETGSDAVDDDADGESGPSEGRARDDADRHSDDSAEVTDGDNPDETVERVDLDADADADTENGADAAAGSANADSPSESGERGSVDESDAAPNGDAPDESADAPDGTTAVVDPVADAVPDAGGPDESPPDRAVDDGAVGPPRAPDPAPAPNAVEGPDADADPETDPHSAATTADAAETEDEFSPVPAESEPRTSDADVAADAHATGTGPESSDIAPIADDAGGHSGFDDDGGIVGEGPAEDEEMPLADHIEEMIHRLGIVFLIGGVVLIAAFPAADRIINFLWNTHIPGAAAPTSPRRPRLYGPLELILTELKVAGLAGFVVGLPALVYQSYRFMRPGLYPKERRYYLASVPTSLVLALVGVAFAHFIVLPAVFAYFTSYTANADIVVAFGLRETFNLILLLMGYMALVFQIPLFMMLAVMMGLVTRRWMTEKRLLFWGGFLGVSFLISPDPTGMTPIIVAATMIVLFEGTLLLIKWTGTGEKGMIG